MSHQAQILVIAKEPRPGFSKTRLTPPCTPVQAAEIARASLLDTLEAVAGTDVLARTVVLDGSPDGWLPAGFEVLPQRTGSLNDRLEGAFHDATAARAQPTLLIGMDTPQVTPALLDKAITTLLQPNNDAVLGLAADGGWWALGVDHPRPGMFDGVPMSTDQAGSAQRDRLRTLGLTAAPLPVLRDIDLFDDLLAVAALSGPDTHLARLMTSLGTVAA